MNRILITLLSVAFLNACAPKDSGFTFIVENELDMDRAFETVELTGAFLGVDNLNNYGVQDFETKEILVTQGVDTDKDQYADVLLFQPRIEANSKRKFELIEIHHSKRPKSKLVCFSRFVPERMDDYAWENDKVAFRVFGPKAQKMAEENQEGGTLSSGVDAWLKRVERPIINKWYRKELNTEGSYHEDDGEGLDNFHVGTSRGVGGLAVKRDSTYHFSKNFSKWKHIASGSIRTSFYLEYEDWDAKGVLIKESKIISLDKGSNLSKYEVSLEGAEYIAAGITLHEKDGVVNGNKAQGWLSYWQPHGDSELGTAIVAPTSVFKDMESYETDQTDLSNAYAHLQMENGKVIYYAGFGWKKSGQFESQKEWEDYLSQFALKLSKPLKVQ
ncbi:DUF4861 family protein [Flagellimonas sp.]|uniref:DUF4861 family protein n=1 Tax=Flagellimonas sp. TaxID=2058762 RepID=UPI003B52410D